MLDHLAADGAGLAGGHGAVVALLEIDADFIGGLHLELVHRGTGLGGNFVEERATCVARAGRL